MKLYMSVICFLSVIAVSAQEAVYMKFNSKDLKSGKVEQAEFYMNSEKLFVEAADSKVLFDSKTESFITIDDKKKEYLVLTKKDLDAAKVQFKQMALLMQSQLKNLPEAQREKIEKQFGAFLGDGKMPQISVSKSGASKVNNWKTTSYKITEDGAQSATMEIASFSTVKTKQSDFEVAKKLVDFFNENLKEFSSILQGNGTTSFLGYGSEGSPVFKEGVPVKLVSYSGGNPKDEITASSVEKKKVEASIFEIPSGYKKTSLLENLQGSFLGN